MSLFKPSESVTVSLGVIAGVAAIYGNLPSVPEIRISEPGDADMDKTEKNAFLLSAAFVSGIAALSKDPTIFVLGGAACIAFSWWHKHASAFDPATGRVSGSGAQPIGQSYAEMAESSMGGDAQLEPAAY